jgi:hypothetical protein
LPRQLNWEPNIIHVNDWHTALAAYGNLVKRWNEKSRRVSSLVTIHNLPFLGPNVKENLEEYGLPLANTICQNGQVMPIHQLLGIDAIIASRRLCHEILHEELAPGRAPPPAPTACMVLWPGFLRPANGSILAVNFNADLIYAAQ